MIFLPQPLKRKENINVFGYLIIDMHTVGSLGFIDRIKSQENSSVSLSIIIHIKMSSI